VRIRLTKDRVVAFLDAGFAIFAKHWNANGKLDGAAWVRAGNKSALSLNSKIENLLREARDLGLASPLLTAAEVRERLVAGEGQPQKPTPKPKASGPPAELLAWAAHYVRERSRTDKANTVKFYASAAAALNKWRNKEPLPLAEVSREDLAEYQQWLLTRAERPLFPGSARDQMKKLSTILRAAVKAGVMPAAPWPFEGLALPPEGNKNPPRRLTYAQRQQLMEFDLSQIKVLRRGANFHASLQIRRDIWSLQYHVRGTRCGDIIRLRERDVTASRISFTETKTGKYKTVARTPPIDAILSRYPATGVGEAFVFPVLDAAQPYASLHPTVAQEAVLADELRDAVIWVNSGLRVIARAAGLPSVTSHSARHMYAERVYDITKDIRIVQASFNHASLSTTEKYMRPLGYDALDAATQDILGEH
jgi:integrase